MNEQTNNCGIGTLPPEVTTYNLRDFHEGFPSQQVQFYKLNPDGTSESGTTLEEMLRVSIARLQDLNARFSCRENAVALTNMEQALMWLNKRTSDRTERGVEGKHLQ